ncbi:MAG: TIM barrel protein [Chloroflexota bacterium]
MEAESFHEGDKHMSFKLTEQVIEERLNTFLGHTLPRVRLTRETAVSLINRIDNIRLHAHSYPHIHNLTYGDWQPIDLLHFAYTHELHGLNINIDKGNPAYTLANSSPDRLTYFKNEAAWLGLAIHLELSSTARTDVDRVVRVALALDATHIRFYSRYDGLLSDAIAKTQADMVYAAGLADRYDLHFHLEQHESFKAAEIVQMLTAVNHPRLHAFFDFSNMINANERPLTALRTLAPYAQQAHLKGAKILPEGNGYAQLGVPQGDAEDDLPNARMLFELLFLGKPDPQIRFLVFEQEVNYYAPPYRQAGEGENPTIPFKIPSKTPFSAEDPLALLQERRWAVNQIHYVKTVLAELKQFAQLF